MPPREGISILARKLMDANRAAAGDCLPPDLLAFHVCRRTVLRADVAILARRGAGVAPAARTGAILSSSGVE